MWIMILFGINIALLCYYCIFITIRLNKLEKYTKEKINNLYDMGIGLLKEIQNIEEYISKNEKGGNK